MEGLGHAVDAADAQPLDIFGDSRNDFVIILGGHGFAVLGHGFAPWVVLVVWLCLGGYGNCRFRRRSPLPATRGQAGGSCFPVLQHRLICGGPLSNGCSELASTERLFGAQRSNRLVMVALISVALRIRPGQHISIVVVTDNYIQFRAT